jgi:hypothetical protein
MTNSRPIAPVGFSDLSAPVELDGNYDTAVAEFSRTKGITRCPTACLAPTQGLISVADRAALEAHAVARDQVYRAKAIAPARSEFRPVPLAFATIAGAMERVASFRDDSADALYLERRRAKLRSYRADLDDESKETLSQQPPEFFRSVVARARNLETEATTATVKRYLRQLISKYEMYQSRPSDNDRAGDLASRPGSSRRNRLRL